MDPNRIGVARNRFCEKPVFRIQYDGFMVESPSLLRGTKQNVSSGKGNHKMVEKAKNVKKGEKMETR